MDISKLDVNVLRCIEFRFGVLMCLQTFAEKKKPPDPTALALFCTWMCSIGTCVWKEILSQQI